MKRTLLWLLLACTPVCANEDQFRERFADPATRTAALAELVPGTQSAYFHTALTHQLAGREDEFQKTMAAWKSASGRKDNPVSADGYEALENRNLLLTYEKNPVTTLAELIRRLDIKFDHARPDAAAAAENLPTALDPALVAESAFEKLAAIRAPQAAYTRFSNDRLLRDLDDVETFDDAKVRYFMEKLPRADLPGVVPLVDRALALDSTLLFTEHPLLKQLTSNQLAALLELRPDVRAKESFATAWLTKLRPGAETDFARDPQAHAAHLQHCRDFVVTLPPALNSLKAHVLFHYLRLQMEQGNFPKADFLTFLALPRATHPLLRVPENPSSTAIQINADFLAATGCPPIVDDTPLIQAYLTHFLGQTDDAAEFAPFVPEKLLAEMHARARLLAGADPAKWSATLEPAAFRALQQEARIAFAPGAPTLLHADAAVSLALDLKNTPNLLIRIYELDLPTYLAGNNSEPEVDIDLDGLVPHHERRIAFAQAPIVQHRESLELPELAGPGAWLVDFVSGQVSARALIRKGSLVPFSEYTQAGQTVRVFDETGAPVAAASVQLGRETFTADANGLITIPDAPNQPLTRGIVRAGKLAAPISLGTRSDEIALDARFHLAREQLLADQEAKLHLRVQLKNHDHPLPLDRLKDPALVLKAELLGGVTTERVIAENLTLEPTMEIPFQVPADLLKLTLTLRGTVIPTTGGDPVKLSQDSTYEINADLQSARIGTAFFSPTADGIRLEVRGRNGEPLPSRAITLTFSRSEYVDAIPLEMRTDADGQILLGPLDDLRVTAVGTDIGEVRYENPRETLAAETFHIAVGSEIRLPLSRPAAAPDHRRFSLIELVDGQFAARDQFDKLAIDADQLIIRGLPAGDFHLQFDDRSADIVVSGGTVRDGLLVSPTRILPVLAPHSPAVANAAVSDDHVLIQLRDHSPATRVSVIGMRYDTPWKDGGLLPFQPPIPDIEEPGFIGNGFLTDRRLGDEMRYILDRRAATPFPGSMLPRPGILLNRWTEETLDQDVQAAQEGIGGTARGTPKRASTSRKSTTSGSKLLPSTADPRVLDFLEFPAVVHFDLTPAADGSLSIPLADFHGCQFLKIVAADEFASATAVLPLPASDTPLRDRRIARPLDPQAHFLATRSAAVLQKDAEATIENLLDADWRAFTTLTEAHQFLFGMTGDDRLREFVFLTEWPTFPEAKKLELLAAHACHELHLFLSRKDPEFFAKFVKPLLAGKPEPQFIDDYLLGRDLAGYLRPFAWQRLNAAEKSLLAQALPAAREQISRELKLRWDLEAPAPDTQTNLFTQTLRGSDLAIHDTLGLARKELKKDSEGVTAGVPYITEKLRNIIIPRIDFEDTSLEEAIDFLRMRSSELDTNELDPSKKGINFVVAPAGASLRIPELRLKNVPLQVVLKYIADMTKMRVKSDDFAVTLVPQTDSNEDRFSDEITTEFTNGLRSGDQAITRNNIDAILNNPNRDVDPFASADADPFAEPAAAGSSALLARRPAAPPVFPDSTKLWREANYYRNTAPTGESLIPLNQFWLDLAAWDGNGSFLSPHFNACHTNGNEALMALALLDLPFKADRPEVTVDGSTLRVKARAPMLLFYKDTRRTDKVAAESPLLVRQTFSPLGEPFRTVDGRQVENPVEGDFRPGIAYTASLIVTNPTGLGRRIDLLAQIPAGAIPLKGNPATRASTHELAPYGVVKQELDFYFPAIGDFAVYPLHVSENGSVLAHTGPRTLVVTNDPAPQDSAVWSVLARDGTAADVLQRLATENLRTIDLDAILWRLKDREFFLEVTRVLGNRLFFSPSVAAYGFFHNDVPSIRDFLENSRVVTQLGDWLDSPLLEIRPRIHRGWESLEFDPLVNPRAHQFGDHPRLTHAEARQHYLAFLDQLGWKPALDATDELGFTYFLFLQDRIEEGLARFDKIDPANLPGRVIYDYLHAVVLFHRDQPEAAKAIADQALPTLPPGLWHDRFQAVADQATEIAALANPAGVAHADREIPEPQLDLAPAADGKIAIQHRGLENATLRMFSVDLEVLFSKDPFLQDTGGASSQPAILPNATFEVALAADAAETIVELPPALRQGNVLVAAHAGTRDILRVLDSRAIDLRHTPESRTVQALDAATGQPLAKAYIKVYAELTTGEVVFHKDGYTDLRGKFDYLTSTATDATRIKRLAVLVTDPKKGARTTVFQR